MSEIFISQYMGNTAPSQFAASIHDMARLRIRLCLDNICLTLVILINLVVVISAIQVCLINAH